MEARSTSTSKLTRRILQLRTDRGSGWSRAANYKVYDDGRVEDVDPRQDSPTASGTSSIAEKREKNLDSLVSRLTRVLEVATAADEAAHGALQREAKRACTSAPRVRYPRATTCRTTR
jgi:hypothetical protein